MIYHKDCACIHVAHVNALTFMHEVADTDLHFSTDILGTNFTLTTHLHIVPLSPSPPPPLSPSSSLSFSVCSCSYFFMEFDTSEQAAAAVKTGNGYKLDKTHIFSVNFFTDFEK